MAFAFPCVDGSERTSKVSFAPRGISPGLRLFRLYIRHSIIISENRRERAFTSSKESLPIPMKAKLQTIECDAEDLIELPEDWIPVRLDLNGYATPSRKAYTLYYLRRA